MAEPHAHSQPIQTYGPAPHNRNIWPHNSRATVFCLRFWPILLFFKSQYTHYYHILYTAVLTLNRQTELHMPLDMIAQLLLVGLTIQESKDFSETSPIIC